MLRGATGEGLSSYPAPRLWQPMGAAGPLGHGQQFWLLPGPRREFALGGVYGPAVHVDPGANLTMVHLAVDATARPAETTMARERAASWPGVVAAFGGGPG